MHAALSRRWRIALATIVLIGATIGLKIPVFAGTIWDTETYAGDVNALALPEGTFIVLDYNSYRHADAFINTGDTFLTRLGNPRDLPADVGAYVGITRIVYFASLWDHPLVLEAAVQYDAIQDANIGNMPVYNVNNNGLGPQPRTNGLIDPVLFFTYGLIVEPKTERFLGFTNYFFLPLGTFNKFNTINLASPNQFTWIPQIEYAEGLEKFVPELKGFWFTLIPHAAVHSDGDANFAVAGVGEFSKLEQDTQYDIEAFLSYRFSEAGYVAVGVEKSWGGEQKMYGATGELALLFPGTTLWLKDDFLKGHVQAVYPVSTDFHVGFDITHDFEREGNFREDFTAEVRFTKFFIPAQSLK
ncbi:MAG: hypothetical protein WBX25_16805 [Rhodomicrobium sp.]